MTVIGMFGIAGVYNFGCEAIVRGAVRFINDLYPEATIYYYSKNYEYDKRMLADLNLCVRPLNSTNTLTKRIANKVNHKLNINKIIVNYDYDQLIEESNVLFSIGGDILTIPVIEREKRKYFYANEIIEIGKRAIANGKKVILYGASVGPFGEYKQAVDYYKNALEQYEMVICREQLSIDYINSLGVYNTIFSPDPAFLVGEISDSTIGECIGVNISPLSLRELYGKVSQQNIKKLAGLLEDLYNHLNARIIMFPHVISRSHSDNDYDFQLRVLEEVAESIKPYISIADFNEGFLGIKKQLKQCRILISARMHCAINAIHECIPTIFLAYSSKSIGMARYIYGNDKYILDLRESDRRLLDTASDLWSNAEIVYSYLYSQNSKIIGDYEDSLISIKGNNCV